MHFNFALGYTVRDAQKYLWVTDLVTPVSYTFLLTQKTTIRFVADNTNNKSHHFERAQRQYDAHLLCLTVVRDHFLNEVLGLAVGVGAAPHWMALIDGQLLGISVHSG